MVRRDDRRDDHKKVGRPPIVSATYCVDVDSNCASSHPNRSQPASSAEYGVLEWRDQAKGGVLCRPHHRQSIAKERA